jgi:hypothetical protein
MGRGVQNFCIYASGVKGKELFTVMKDVSPEQDKKKTPLSFPSTVDCSIRHQTMEKIHPSSTV